MKKVGYIIIIVSLFLFPPFNDTCISIDNEKQGLVNFKKNVVILPFKVDAISTHLRCKESDIVDGIISLLKGKYGDFDIIGSCYKDNADSLKKIDQSICKEIDRSIWIDRKLNVSRIRKLAIDKNANIAVTYSIKSDSSGDTFCCYLIDVFSEKVYKKCGFEEQTPLQMFISYGSIKSYMGKLFDEYIQDPDSSFDSNKQFESAIQASKPSKNIERKPSIKLAILPFRFQQGANPSYFINDLGKVIEQNHRFKVTYSHYELRLTHSTESVPDFTEDNLWVKKSFFSDVEPNFDFVLNLGADLEIDAVLLCDLYVGSADPPPAKYSAFLFSIRSGNRYVIKASTDNFDNEGTEVFKRMIREVLSQYPF